MATVAGAYRPVRASTRAAHHDVADGLRWLKGQPMMRGLVIAIGFAATLHAMVMAVLVLYALDVVGLNEAGYGLLLLAGGLGGLLGGLVAPPLSTRVGRIRTLVAVSLASPLCLIAMGLLRSPILGAVLLGVSGCAIMISNVITMSLRQSLIPEALFGRVQGVWRTIVWGGIAIGSLLGGFLAALTDVPTVFIAGGLAGLATGAVVSALFVRHRSTITAAHERGCPVRQAVTST
jgi:predicted MFS family arabinose efflux permease